MTTIGIIGAGNIGSQIARAAIDNGYDIVISNSRGPQSLSELVAELGPRASAATPAEAGSAGDFVVVTIPTHAIDQVPVAPLAGKIVLDTNNYYPQRDGQIAVLDDKTDTVSGMLQKLLPTSKVVKAFNHIRSEEITTAGTPAGTAGRRALAVSSDFAEATALATKLYDEFGFDAVDVGPLAESWRVERDQPAYVVAQNAEELRTNLTKATR